ncbi:MAG: two-component sensor histidine kinase [Gemmataceae bacterium]|nr:two-component sensor histidine kinase [Gemmataceae bacterium]
MPDAAVADPPTVEAGQGADAPRSPEQVEGPTPPARQEAPANLNDLAELAGGFIHDLKNHLGTLSLNLQLLAEDFEAPQSPRERKALDRVTKLHAECRKLADLANDFLRFARAQNPAVRPVSLDAVVTRMIDFLAPTARAAGIEVHWFPAPGLPPVLLDRDLFEQALLNLMLNAEQAMPDGGTLTLVGRVESVSASVSEDGAADGFLPSPHTHTHTRTHTVCLDVIDTGCGMSPDVLAKAFRPFHTTKKGGHGLGLATARKVVEAHGGTMEVQSEPGRGTKFTIRLPAAG